MHFGTKIYRTDQNGEISITVNNKGNVKIRKFIQNIKDVKYYMKWIDNSTYIKSSELYKILEKVK